MAAVQGDIAAALPQPDAQGGQALLSAAVAQTAAKLANDMVAKRIRVQ